MPLSKMPGPNKKKRKRPLTIREKLFFFIFFTFLMGLVFSNVLDQYFAHELIQSVPPLLWTKIALVLFLVCVVLIIVVEFQTYKLQPKFQFIKNLGVTRDINTGEYICTACHSKNIRSPLKERPTAWACQTKGCKTVYYKPGYEPAPNSKDDILGGGWVKGF